MSQLVRFEGTQTAHCAHCAQQDSTGASSGKVEMNCTPLSWQVSIQQWLRVAHIWHKHSGNAALHIRRYALTRVRLTLSRFSTTGNNAVHLCEEKWKFVPLAKVVSWVI